jgi:thioredoxin reductase
VIVVGGGPAGLACALELRRRGLGVTVLERERRAGGIPRHSRHQGFGLRVGARVVEEAMATGWTADGSLEVTSPAGREVLGAAAVVLATGCRERPRAARLVPGSRPDGVLTTGLLQQLVELHGRRVGERALVVGAEHVSFSALLTLAHGGADVVAMVTDLPRHQSLALVRAGAALRYRTPLWTDTAVTGIYGRPRVEEVELSDLRTGEHRRVACDTVVFTGDWIPDHELAVLAGAELDPQTRGPRVDPALRTSRPGLFAAGNLLRGAEPADVAALDGRHAAAAVSRWLSTGERWAEEHVPLVCRPPLHWIAPNALGSADGPPPRGRFLLRSSAFLRRPVIDVRQGARLLWSEPLSRLVPGRSAVLGSDWTTRAKIPGEAVEIAVAER